MAETPRARVHIPSTWVLVAGLLSLAPAYVMLPAVDDWGTIRPVGSGGLGDSAGELFFRPLHDALTLVGLWAPAIYIPFLHTATILGHLVSVTLVARLAGPSRNIALLAAGLFAVHPGAAAAVWSLDSATQTWSTACGLGALWLSRRAGPGGYAWPLLALLASIWKESGIAWFLLVPVYIWFTNRSRGQSHFVKPVPAFFAGALGVLFYASLRALGAQALQLGASGGRYALQWEPGTWGLHLLQLVGVSWTTIDTVSLFGTSPAYPWAMASALASLPLLCLLLHSLLRRGAALFLLGALLIALSAGPHLGLGHVSEMYAHPIIAVSVLVFVEAAPERPRRTTLWVAALALAASGAVAVLAHKAWCMWETGLAARQLGQRVALRFEVRPRTLCSVPHANPAVGYSVFDVPAARASGWGASVLGEWDWLYPKTHWVRSEEAACEALRPDATIVFIDATTFVVKRRSSR